MLGLFRICLSSGLLTQRYLCILETEEECISVGSYELHAGHWHNIAEERKRCHMLQLLSTGFGICNIKVKYEKTHTCYCINHKTCVSIRCLGIPDDLSAFEVLWNNDTGVRPNKDPLVLGFPTMVYTNEPSWQLLPPHRGWSCRRKAEMFQRQLDFSPCWIWSCSRQKTPQQWGCELACTQHTSWKAALSIWQVTTFTLGILTSLFCLYSFKGRSSKWIEVTGNPLSFLINGKQTFANMFDLQEALHFIYQNVLVPMKTLIYYMRFRSSAAI